MSSILRDALPLWRDELKGAVRRLWRSPGFSLCAVATIMLCVGANAAIFSTLHALVLKRLPFAEPEQLIEVANNYPKTAVSHAQVSIGQYLDFREHADAFDAIGLYRRFGGSIGGDGRETIRVNIARVTHEFFAALRLEPLAGRFFTEDESVPGNDTKLLLTESFWETRYGRDPAVVGRTVLFSDEPFTVVGVLPRAVEVIDPTIHVFKPTDWTAGWLSERYRHTQASRVVGRLFCRMKPGVTISQSRAQLEALEQRFHTAASQEYRDFLEGSGHTFTIAPMQDARLGDAKGRLYLLQAAALLVLVIGCINITNLLLARADSRSSELALRRALGGSRFAIVRQWLLEPFLLTFCGGVLAIGVTWGGIALINRYALPFLPRVVPFELDLTIVSFALVLSALTAAIISLLPLERILRPDLISVIRRGAVNTTSDRRLRFSGMVLIPVQIAVSLALLATTGLLLRSFLRVAQTDPGFQTQHLVTVRTAVEPARQRDVEGVRQLHARIFAELRSIPGVQAVAMAAQTPLHEDYVMLPLRVQGAAAAPGGAQPMVHIVPIVGDYFPALGIPVIQGRALDERDSGSEHNTILIDQLAAERYFPGVDPLGRKVAVGPITAGREPDWMTVVGVVGHARYDGLDEKNVMPYCYVPEPKFRMAGNSYFVRSTRAPDELLPIVQARIRAVDNTLAQFQFGAMDELVARSLDDRRALVIFLGLFAGLALFLASLGTYGVLSYEVAQRTREIGIRCALGATQHQVMRRILTEAAGKACVGIVVGAGAAFYIGRLMTAALFEIPPHDPTTFLTSSLVLLAVTLLAAALPAWRAAHIDPARALRAE